MSGIPARNQPAHGARNVMTWNGPVARGSFDHPAVAQQAQNEIFEWNGRRGAGVADAALDAELFERRQKSVDRFVILPEQRFIGGDFAGGGAFAVDQSKITANRGT